MTIFAMIISMLLQGLSIRNLQNEKFIQLLINQGYNNDAKFVKTSASDTQTYPFTT
jgi:hypothetical protein